MTKNNGYFELLSQFYTEFLKPQLDKIEEAVKKNSEDIQGLKVETRYVKDELNGIKAELSSTVSKKEFNELETKVEEIASS